MNRTNCEYLFIDLNSQREFTVSSALTLTTVRCAFQTCVRVLFLLSARQNCQVVLCIAISALCLSVTNYLPLHSLSLAISPLFFSPIFQSLILSFYLHIFRWILSHSFFLSHTYTHTRASKYTHTHTNTHWHFGSFPSSNSFCILIFLLFILFLSRIQSLLEYFYNPQKQCNIKLSFHVAYDGYH